MSKEEKRPLKLLVQDAIAAWGRMLGMDARPVQYDYNRGYKDEL